MSEYKNKYLKYKYKYMSEYKNKYLKYKNKYLNLKNQFVGGMNLPVLIPPEGEQFIHLINFMTRIWLNTDISRLGKLKIVATTKSPQRTTSKPILDAWNIMDPNTKAYFKYINFKQYGWNLGIYEYEGIAIFYVIEYLNLLAIASNKTSNELLEIFSNHKIDNKIYIDIILIAFGDIFKMTDWHYNKQIETAEGINILSEYKRLANIPNNIDKLNILRNYQNGQHIRNHMILEELERTRSLSTATEQRQTRILDRLQEQLR
jgi:hypothetical protein